MGTIVYEKRIKRWVLDMRVSEIAEIPDSVWILIKQEFKRHRYYGWVSKTQDEGKKLSEAMKEILKITGYKVRR